MKHHFLVAAAMAFFVGSFTLPGRRKSELWVVDNLTRIGGHAVAIEGNPRIIGPPGARGLDFNGRDDGVILDTNPLTGARTFTIEVVFHPDPGGNQEQRFLHMQSSEERRVLIETRLKDKKEWFLDTFIKCGQSERTLQSKGALHPLGKWYHVALVCDGREMRHFVNRTLEMAGAVAYTPLEAGQTSIGCRLNRVFWFKGGIRLVRITHDVLKPEEFLSFTEE